MGDKKQEQSKIQLQYLLESLTQNFLIICKNSSFLLIPETIALQTYQERTSSRIFYLTFFLNQTTVEMTYSPWEHTLKKC